MPQVERFDTVTEDLGEIDELTRAMYGASVRVERGDGSPPSLRLGQAAVSEFAAQRMTWNVDGRCRVAPRDRFVCVRVRAGSCRLDQGRGRAVYGAGDTFLLDPGRPVDAEVLGADLDSFTIHGSVLEEMTSQIAPWSRGRLDFSSAVPVNAELGRAWDDVLDHVVQVLAESDVVAESPLIRAALLRQLVATACAAFELIPEHRQQRPASERSVRRAVAYIDEHLAEPITVGDIAAATGLSTRGLHSAFVRVLSIPPNAYLRRARLDAARRDLLNPNERSSVSGIARRWGFAHLGRFSGSYRNAFGELPSTTLRV